MSKCTHDWRVTGFEGSSVLCFNCGSVEDTEDLLASLEFRLEEMSRAFTIVDEACDFWKDTALELGYNEE